MSRFIASSDDFAKPKPHRLWHYQGAQGIQKQERHGGWDSREGFHRTGFDLEFMGSKRLGQGNQVIVKCCGYHHERRPWNRSG